MRLIAINRLKAPLQTF